MHIFYINILISIFFMSSTSFEYIVRRSYIQLGFRTFYTNQYQKFAYTDARKMYCTSSIYS